MLANLKERVRSNLGGAHGGLRSQPSSSRASRTPHESRHGGR